jgi:trehalose-phosphatase
MSRLDPPWAVMRDRLAGAKRVLVLLDFDGTLSPIVPAPRSARMSPGLKSLLARLNAHPKVHIGIISGRSLPDVSRRVGLETLYYAGNHGLEMQGPDFSFQHPRAFLLRPSVEALGAEGRRTFQGVPGVLVESKHLSLAVHDRRVAAQDRPGFLERLRRFRAATAGRPFRWRRGRRVWELLPRVAWDKGRAAALLSRHLGNPFPIVVGDDRTDEDMFQAMNEGLTIRVDPSGKQTYAHYMLPSQAEVPLFLERLLNYFQETAHERQAA